MVVLVMISSSDVVRWKFGCRLSLRILSVMLFVISVRLVWV